MQVVVGDPLARVQRSSEDIDGDGTIGAGDLYAWEAAPVDVKRNGTTDANDRLLVVRAVRAPERAMMLLAR
jgi:hypothetical protein